MEKARRSRSGGLGGSPAGRVATDSEGKWVPSWSCPLADAARVLFRFRPKERKETMAARPEDLLDFVELRVGLETWSMEEDWW